MSLFAFFSDRITELLSRERFVFQSTIVMLGLQTLLVLSRPTEHPRQWWFNLLACFSLTALLISLMRKPGVHSLSAPSFFIAALGGLGMEGGAIFGSGSCCSSAHASVSWSFWVMTILCAIGCQLCSGTPNENRWRFVLRVGSCIFLMSVGMWVSGGLLEAALTIYFGPFGAAHWSMLAGMFLGTLAGEALFKWRSI